MMPGQNGIPIVARVGRFFILRLGEIPIPLFGSVKMVASGAAKSVFRADQRQVTVPDGTTKFKHIRSVTSGEMQGSER